MIKTKSYIEAITVNGDRPKNNGLAVVVRAPKTMKCFRATFVVNNYGSNLPCDLFIATSPTNQEEQCLYLSGNILTSVTGPAPTTDTTFNAPQTFVFDRRGVGYMTDEFYLYSVDANVTIIWEGISEQ
jgi:hypothetical protein